jgi:predicted phosphodiesterase
VIGLAVRAWRNQIVMRIGLISDTHMPEACEHLAKRVFEVFAGIDLVMHAGDVYVTRFGATMVVNPGSATLPRNLVGVPGTVAILEIGKRGEVSAEIISLG